MNILRFIIPKSLVEYIEDDSTVRQTLEKMRAHRYTSLPVLDKYGKYLGTVSSDDIFHYFLKEKSFEIKTAEEDGVLSVLTPRVRALRHDAAMEELFERVKEHNSVPVVDDRGCFIGIILRREVLSYLMTFYKGE